MYESNESIKKLLAYKELIVKKKNRKKGYKWLQGAVDKAVKNYISSYDGEDKSDLNREFIQEIYKSLEGSYVLDNKKAWKWELRFKALQEVYNNYRDKDNLSQSDITYFSILLKNVNLYIQKKYRDKYRGELSSLKEELALNPTNQPVEPHIEDIPRKSEKKRSKWKDWGKRIATVALGLGLLFTTTYGFLTGSTSPLPKGKQTQKQEIVYKLDNKKKNKRVEVDRKTSKMVEYKGRGIKLQAEREKKVVNEMWEEIVKSIKPKYVRKLRDKRVKEITLTPYLKLMRVGDDREWGLTIQQDKPVYKEIKENKKKKKYKVNVIKDAMRMHGIDPSKFYIVIKEDHIKEGNETYRRIGVYLEPKSSRGTFYPLDVLREIGNGKWIEQNWAEEVYAKIMPSAPTKFFSDIAQQ